MRSERAGLATGFDCQADYLGIGVDRLDYTKGIPERFRGIERFLEKHPSYQGRFTHVQIGAPSRTHIHRYQDLIADVEAEAERINQRFQTRQWKPIVFLKEHHNHDQIEPYYRMADICLVTSLHDGMNLVAKEFVATRSDEEGVLILSLFAGASLELEDALIVNPYDTDQVADAIHYALEMDPHEKRERMRRMRRVVKHYNIYRWAANLIGAASEVRLDPIQRSKAAVSIQCLNHCSIIFLISNPCFGHHRRVLVFLDFDGTLTPIVDFPNQAVMPPETRDTLKRLSAIGKCSITIVSGRALNDIRERVGMANLTYAGNHGLEICGDGLHFVEPGAVQRIKILGELSRRLRERLRHIPGVEVENKVLTDERTFSQGPARQPG